MTATLMRTARQLIEQRAAWLRLGFACSAQGLFVDPQDPAAIKWSIEGAMQRVIADVDNIVTLQAYAHEFWFADSRGLNQILNDDPSTTHEAILAKFDECIAAYEALPEEP